MDERTLIDELNALAAGSLSPEEEGRLRDRCARDPELAALLEEYLEVHALTSLADTGPPPCRLDFADVEAATRRKGGVVPLMDWRVAAAVLVLVVGGFVLSQAVTTGDGGTGSGREPATPVLSAIPLVGGSFIDEAELAKEFESLEVAADYRPVADTESEANGEIQWIDSYADGRAVARWASRPVLLFVHHETCPMCRQMRKGTLSNPQVAEAVDRFVPAMSNVMKEKTGLDLGRIPYENWPWFGAVDADGGVILPFPGMRDAAGFLDEMKEAARLAGPTPPAWNRVNQLASRLLEARASEREARYADAHRAYLEITREENAHAFAAAASRGIERIGQGARRALVRARDLVRSPPGVAAALSDLDEAIRRYADTPYEVDLRAVRDYLAETSRFPEIPELE